MTCTCGPEVEVGNYKNCAAVLIPEHMADYRRNRMAAGLSGFVGVDRCILDEIQLLWALGIRTYGSCCGHHVQPSMVNVHEDDVPVMLVMGYQIHPYASSICPHTFALNTGTRPPEGKDTV